VSTGLLDRLEELFTGQGARDYLGEEVSMATHMLQAADRARDAGAAPALIAAALLHDIGHFTGLLTGADLMEGTDNHHDEQAAAFLAQHYGPEVAEPVRLHVAAKRYLCCGAARVLRATLTRVGIHAVGTGRADERRGGGQLRGERPTRGDAVLLRRCDDAAKDAARPTPTFAEFRELLAGLLRDGTP